MARLAITIGRIGDKWQVVGQPSNDVGAHKDLFRKINSAGGKHEGKELHELQSFTTDGFLSKRKTFETDAQKQAHAKLAKADDAKRDAANKKRLEEIEKAKKPAVVAAVKKEVVTK